MACKITAYKTFEKELKRLGKRYASIADDFAELLSSLQSNPIIGTDLGGGLRKIRMKITSKGKGKSGGARIITFNVVASINDTEVNLIYIYDKTERSNITKQEIEKLLIKLGLNN